MSSLAMTDYPEAPLFSDGLGERVVVADGATGELLQILRIRPALTAVASFEFALRERTARLANFRHAYYTRVRRIDRAMPPGGSLAVVSEYVVLPAATVAISANPPHPAPVQRSMWNSLP